MHGCRGKWTRLGPSTSTRSQSVEISGAPFFSTLLNAIVLHRTDTVRTAKSEICRKARNLFLLSPCAPCLCAGNSCRGKSVSTWTLRCFSESCLCPVRTSSAERFSAILLLLVIFIESFARFPKSTSQINCFVLVARLPAVAMSLQSTICSTALSISQ